MSDGSDPLPSPVPAPPDDQVETFFALLSQRAGTPKLGPDEADEVLKLARVVAHRVERRFAPLAAYVLGLATGASGESADVLARTERVRALTRLVAEIAPAAAREPGPPGG